MADAPSMFKQTILPPILAAIVTVGGLTAKEQMWPVKYEVGTTNARVEQQIVSLTRDINLLQVSLDTLKAEISAQLDRIDDRYISRREWDVWSKEVISRIERRIDGVWRSRSSKGRETNEYDGGD
jgi:hypothetical protein